MAGPFCVLVIESDADESAELRRLLQNCEYSRPSGPADPPQITVVSNLDIALNSYEEIQPDVIVFGLREASAVSSSGLRQLRHRGGLEPVPILLVKAESDTVEPAIQVTGCDDILIKPYSISLVQLKLAAIRRFCDFNRSLIAQRDRLRRQQADFLHEQASARQIFDNLGHEGCLKETPAIRYHLSPRAVLNGDLLAATYTPDGKLVLLLGDFTGHGLAAAVGAVPATSIFYSMVPRGFSFSRVLREINRKLHGILPAQMFCCVTMLELDPLRNHLRLFNGGMPSPCVRRNSGELHLLESRHLPLGVLAEDAIEQAIVNVPIDPGDRLYLWSDGIHEARNQRGDHFGEARLCELLAASSGSPEQLFDQILVAVSAFTAEQQDDLSLVELDLTDPSLRKESRVADISGERKVSRVGEWSIDFVLRAAELRTADPLPQLLSVLIQMPGAARFQEELAIVLGELFRNALEHGVLQLDSSLKQSEEGFAYYYSLLAERQQQLSDGWIKIGLTCHDWTCGGELQLIVEDSGAGFPPASWDSTCYSGRGLPLLRSVCSDLFLEPGSSRVCASIGWGEPGKPAKSIEPRCASDESGVINENVTIQSDF